MDTETANLAGIESEIIKDSSAQVQPDLLDILEDADLPETPQRVCKIKAAEEAMLNRNPFAKASVMALVFLKEKFFANRNGCALTRKARDETYHDLVEFIDRTAKEKKDEIWRRKLMELVIIFDHLIHPGAELVDRVRHLGQLTHVLTLLYSPWMCIAANDHTIDTFSGVEPDPLVAEFKFTGEQFQELEQLWQDTTIEKARLIAAIDTQDTEEQATIMLHSLYDI